MYDILCITLNKPKFLDTENDNSQRMMDEIKKDNHNV